MVQENVNWSWSVDWGHLAAVCTDLNGSEASAMVVLACSMQNGAENGSLTVVHQQWCQSLACEFIECRSVFIVRLSSKVAAP